ncbi:unnamed protein product [Alopecurus aequalis]
MGSTEAILSAQMASKCFSINKFMTSPVPQMQKQSESRNASGSRGQVEKKDTSSSAVKIVGNQQQRQHLKPRFALELDGLNCFETIVPL